MANDSIICPQCKFPNYIGEVCLLCKTDLPSAGGKAGVFAWVRCDPLPSLALERGMGELTVGRTSKCDMRLPHGSVSRCQGVFRRGEQGFVYEDRSTNGSLHNGKRVTGTCPIEVGDVIQIGPYELQIVAEDVNLEDSELSRTTNYDFSAVQTGQIADTSVMETLQGLEFNRKTGVFKVRSGRVLGELRIRDGAPLSAVFGPDLAAEEAARGDEAIIALLGVTEGRFEFEATTRAVDAEPMGPSLTAIMFEFTRRDDEQLTKQFKRSPRLEDLSE